MTTIAHLHQAIQATLASQRLGRVVFVRYHVQASDAADAVVGRLARLAAVVQSWLRQPWDRILAVGRPDNSHVALTLQFREGGTALLTFSRAAAVQDAADRKAQVNLMVFGNHGALYHDFEGGPLQDQPDGFDPVLPDPALVRLIEQALHSGGPESVPQEAKP
jgi:hypothetical protein